MAYKFEVEIRTPSPRIKVQEILLSGGERIFFDERGRVIRIILHRYPHGCYSAEATQKAGLNFLEESGLEGEVFEVREEHSDRDPF